MFISLQLTSLSAHRDAVTIGLPRRGRYWVDTMKRSLSARLAAIVALVALLPAGQVTWAHGQTPAVVPGVFTRADAGTVIGTVWSHNDAPIARARLRLRDVTSGQVVRTTQADELGRFTFVKVAPGSYIVELVDNSGKILALGQMFALGPVETVATFIRLGAPLPWYAGFFSNAAAAALASASSLGLTSLGNGGQPASGRS